MPMRSNMPMAEEPDSSEQDPDRTTPELAVRLAVMVAFRGAPGVLRVVVRPLWPNHFRVNVFVGPDAASASIAHSYFVQAGDGGEILSANPRLPARPHLSGRTVDARN